MKKFLTLLFVTCCLLLAPTGVFAQTATMSVDPATGTVNKGCLFPVNININAGGAETDGADAILLYDSSRFTAQSVTTGSIYPDYPVSSIDSTAGKINVSGIASVATPFSGSGIFATVNFMVSENAPTGATQLTFDFDPQDKAKTTDSNIVQRATIVDILGSVVNGNYTIGEGSACTTQTTTPIVIGRGGVGDATPAATAIPIETLPSMGTPELTFTLALVGGVLTVLGILGLALL